MVIKVNRPNGLSFFTVLSPIGASTVHEHGGSYIKIQYGYSTRYKLNIQMNIVTMHDMVAEGGGVWQL